MGRIAAATGYKASNIEKVKRHLFFNVHLLDRYIGQGSPAVRQRFDSHKPIAEAWTRLQTATFTAEDLQFLKHEIAEAWYMRKVAPGYSAAHNAAERRFPTPECVK